MWIEFLILGFFTFLDCADGGESITTTSTEYSTDYSLNSVNGERYSYSARVSYLFDFLSMHFNLSIFERSKIACMHVRTLSKTALKRFHWNFVI